MHGRIYPTIDDVRDAVHVVVNRYNAQWLIAKNDYRFQTTQEPLGIRARSG